MRKKLKEPCKNCGARDYFATRGSLLDGKISYSCDRCNGAVGVKTPYHLTAQGQKVKENATKNLDRSKHTYVPPANENSVGGVFEKN